MKVGFYAMLFALVALIVAGCGGAEDVARSAAADSVSWRGVVFAAGSSEDNYAAAAALDPCVLEQLYPGVEGPYMDPLQHPEPDDHIWAYGFSSDNPDDVEGALTTCGHGEEIVDLEQTEWFPLPCGTPFPPCQ